MTIEVPPKMNASGGAISSAAEAAGHGIWFETKGILELVGEAERLRIPFVRNHDTEISASAGVIIKTTAEKGEVSLPTYDGEGKQVGTTKVPTALLRFKAALSDDFPAYQEVAGSMLALQKNGAIPQVSVQVLGKGFSYERETRRFIYTGPYRLTHIGHVYAGALSPDSGVGVFEIKAQPGEAMTAAVGDEGPVLACDTRVFIPNASEACLSFAEKYGAGLAHELAVKLGLAESEDDEDVTSEQYEPDASAFSVQKLATVAYQNLPLAARGRVWDAGAARKRITAWAGGEKSMDWAKYAKAFLWYDGEKSRTTGAYKLPIADVIGGRLTAVPRGVFAASGVIQGARGAVNISDSDIAIIKSHLGKYYKRIGETPPWEKKGASSVSPSIPSRVGETVGSNTLPENVQLDGPAQPLQEAASGSNELTSMSQKPGIPTEEKNETTIPPVPAAEPPVPAASPPAASAKPSVSVEELAAKLEIQDAKFAAMEKRESEEKVAALTSKRDSVAQEFDATPEELAEFTSIKQLEVFERSLRALRTNPLPARKAAKDEEKIFNVAEQYLATGGNPNVIKGGVQ